MDGSRIEGPEEILASAQECLAKGRADEARRICESVLKSEPDNARAYVVLGQTFLSSGEYRRAETAFKNALRIEPQLLVALNMMSFALQAQNRIEASLDFAQQALELSPSSSEALTRVGQMQLALKRPEEAIVLVRHAIELNENSPAARLILCQSYLELGQEREAELAVEFAVEFDPRDYESHILLATLRQQQGRFEEASEVFKKAIALQPYVAAPYFGLTYSRKTSQRDGQLIHRMTEMARRPERSASERLLFHYALGKSFDDLKIYEDAIQHFDAANQLNLEVRKRKGDIFDRNVYKANLRRIVEFCGQEQSEPQERSPRPIFIVGMIRSGTTLVEQILGSHPAIEPGGEIGFWLGETAETLLTSSVKHIGDDWIATTRKNYEEVLNRISTSSPHVTDKMPTNYQVLGAILRCYPDAKIIHCRRDPVDTCLSVFVTPFKDPPGFGNDRENIVFAYREYERLMVYWRRAFPAAKIWDVNYESLVERPQAVIAEMLAFLGLEWDDRCLEPGGSRRMVSTPSRWQVRQPLYKESAGRSKNYERWLGPFADLRSD